MLAAWLAFYYATASHLWQAGLWPDVLFIGFVLMPSTLALVYFGLPFRRWHGLAPVGLAFVILALAFRAAHLLTLADFAKLAAMIAIGLWFLSYFETIGWVVLIACIVPWVDAYSVWRGPTSKIVEHHGSTFSLLSFSFPVPGEHAAAHLGLPDLLFFTLFLGAADRFGLRVRLTWLALVVSLGVTLVVAVGVDVAGLPALPFLSAGFLLANADLLWQRLRPGRDEADAVAPSP